MTAIEVQQWCNARSAQIHASLVQGRYVVTVADLDGEICRSGLRFDDVLASVMEAYDRQFSATRHLERVADGGAEWTTR